MNRAGLFRSINDAIDATVALFEIRCFNYLG
jgi:hypothetical protein